MKCLNAKKNALACQGEAAPRKVLIIFYIALSLQQLNR